MKKSNILIAITLLIAVVFFSCQNEKAELTVENEISAETLDKIQALGFSTHDVQKEEDGYRVEGCIVLTEENLHSCPNHAMLLRVGNEEQYRTYNLVTNLPRVITVSIDKRLPSSYVAALDIALARYNAQNLDLTFQRTNRGDIQFTVGTGGYLASAGFPTSTGEPYSRIKVNASYLGTNPDQDMLATIMAHEMGHCIGLRHTDYSDRSYSCGGAYANEGASTVGAVYIPGTSVGPEPNSFMLACIGLGDNRPFSNNDKTALDYLY